MCDRCAGSRLVGRLEPRSAAALGLPALEMITTIPYHVARSKAQRFAASDPVDQLRALRLCAFLRPHPCPECRT